MVTHSNKNSCHFGTDNELFKNPYFFKLFK